MLDLEERHAIEATLRRLAAKIDRTLFGGEGPDGDLGRIPQLLAEAQAMAVIADPAPDAPGYDLGVWGRGCQEEGLTRSLLTLSFLGEACAGFATAVHAQGLACLALDKQIHFPPATSLAAAFTLDYGVPLSARTRSVGSGLRLMDNGDTLQLDGTSHFLLAADAPQGLVCFAQKAGADGVGPKWGVLIANADAPGIELSEVTGRTGLRAARQYHLRCNRVIIPRDRVLHVGDAAWRVLEQVMACDWLGQAAIALGVARRSLRDSRAYTAQRYQGGQIIKEHASIQLLQGMAEYDIALLEAILYQYADVPLSSQDTGTLLRWGLQARLAVVEHAQRAVTNCLQTLGGYGYMEDYGFEKRLRDVSTLKSLHGAPDQLKLFLNELARRE
jgi:alkylation response protein AidB-like acyl-CoA dehydrogenase